MLEVYLSAVRRIAPLGAVSGGFVGLVFASTIMSEDGGTSDVVITFLEFAVAFTVVFTTFIAAGSTLTALRAARRAGVRPSGDMLGTEQTGETFLTDVPERHANHVLGSLLDRLGSAADLRQRDTEADGTATAVFIGHAPTGFPVTVAVRVAARDGGFLVRVRTTPAQSWKKLDGGACWEVLRSVLRMAEEGMTTRSGGA